MAINGKLLAGASCAAFLGGILLGATVLLLYLHIRGPRNISSAPSPSPSNGPPQPRPKIKPNWWSPQPEGFDLKEHNIITVLDSTTVSIRCQNLQSAISSFSISVQWRDLSASTLRTLANDAFAAVILRKGYDMSVARPGSNEV